MLAHKVDGESPVTYSELLLAAQKLERWAEARDPLLLKTTTTGGSNMTCSHSQGALFPSRKLKGSHTFTARAAAVEDHEVEEDSSPKPSEEKGAESSAEEDIGQSGEGVGTDQLLGYIVQFANAVELYQKKNLNCFRCGNLDHLVKDCTKDLGKTTRKVGLNLKEGMAKKGGQTSEVGSHPTGYSKKHLPGVKMFWKAPFLNPNPLMHWSAPENIAWVRINGESCWALLDSGSTKHAVTP